MTGIGSKLGCTKQAVQKRLSGFRKDAERMADGGVPVSDIAQSLAVDAEAVEAALDGRLSAPASKARRVSLSGWQDAAVAFARKRIPEGGPETDAEAAAIVEEIAEKHGKTERWVRAVLREAGISLSRRTTEEERAHIVSLVRAKMTYRQVAEATGWSVSMVEKAAQAAGVACGRQGRRPA